MSNVVVHLPEIKTETLLKSLEKPQTMSTQEEIKEKIGVDEIAVGLYLPNIEEEFQYKCHFPKIYMREMMKCAKDAFDIISVEFSIYNLTFVVFDNKTENFYAENIKKQSGMISLFSTYSNTKTETFVIHFNETETKFLENCCEDHSFEVFRQNNGEKITFDSTHGKLVIEHSKTVMDMRNQFSHWLEKRLVRQVRTLNPHKLESALTKSSGYMFFYVYDDSM